MIGSSRWRGSFQEKERNSFSLQREQAVGDHLVTKEWTAICDNDTAIKAFAWEIAQVPSGQRWLR